MSKRKRNIDDSSRDTVGAVMTVSLFLIILTFFVLLNSIAKIDERKSFIAIGSLLGAFGSFEGGLSPLATGSLPIPGSAPMVEEKLEFDDLLSLMSPEISGEIHLETELDKEIISINERALFAENTPVLRASSYPLLNELSSIINKGKYSVEIVGHTDSRVAEEKGYGSNWELSGLMAIRVLKYLVKEGEVSHKRLTARGQGSHKPIAPNDTRQSRALNRRVEIILTSEAPAYVKRIFRKRRRGIFTYKKFIFRIFGNE